MTTDPTALQGIVFDKDGTLFDFNATWGAWTAGMIADEAGGDAALTARLADILGYDLSARVFRPGSIVIAETTTVVADAMLPALPGVDRDGLVRRMKSKATQVPQIEATPLRALMQTLAGRGLRLGVCTNDALAPAQTHLARAGIDGMMDFVAGYDSGHGAKPGPGQLHAFCAATGLHPARCLMIGDSTHDLHAGRAAGMVTMGVLTGPATRADLAPHADVVLASIADLPEWLAG